MIKLLGNKHLYFCFFFVYETVLGIILVLPLGLQSQYFQMTLYLPADTRIFFALDVKLDNRHRSRNPAIHSNITTGKIQKIKKRISLDT